MFTDVSRRTLLRSTGAGVALAAVGGSPSQAQAKKITIGFIYVGPKGDYGYNQAHAEGAAAIKRMPGLTVVEEERVPETDDVEKTMQSMIQLDGASLVFPTSFGYFDPHMLKHGGQKYPEDTSSAIAAGCGTKDEEPDEHRVLFRLYRPWASSSTALPPPHATKSKKIGFVAAKPIPQVLINVNSFALGAMSVDPSASRCTVIFTGEWSMPVKEAEATNSADRPRASDVDHLPCRRARR